MDSYNCNNTIKFVIISQFPSVNYTIIIMNNLGARWVLHDHKPIRKIKKFVDAVNLRFISIFSEIFVHKCFFEYPSYK